MKSLTYQSRFRNLSMFKQYCFYSNKHECHEQNIRYEFLSTRGPRKTEKTEVLVERFLVHTLFICSKCKAVRFYTFFSTRFFGVFFLSSLSSRHVVCCISILLQVQKMWHSEGTKNRTFIKECMQHCTYTICTSKLICQLT